MRPGEANIHFIYDRPWQHDGDAAQRYELMVVVTP